MRITGVDPLLPIQSIKPREEGRQFNVETREKASNKPSEKQGQDNLKLFTQQHDISKEKLEQAIEQANDTMRTYNRNLNFQLHKASGEWLVQVVNSETEEVIREIPPEWLLDIVAYFRDMVGVLVDELV